MIIITGAAGFIGSCLAAYLNSRGRTDLILVDDFSRSDKEKNWQGRKYTECIPRMNFFETIPSRTEPIEMIFHLGARTDTTEMDKAIFDELNVNYSKQIWQFCVDRSIPLIYASSAATYGNGEKGYRDNEEGIAALIPLNPYGHSKQEFDLWVLEQSKTPPFWAGLKFFNVYGPNEYHKGRMASVVWHAFGQIQKTEKMRSFRSHRPGYKDGEQQRDFIYVKDVLKVMEFLMQHQKNSGVYNVGTGKARTFLDLVTLTFHALDKTPSIEFIDTPLDIRDTYHNILRKQT